MRRSLSVWLFGVVGLLACHRQVGLPREAPVARIPRDAARFEISSLNDSTVSFRKMEARWVRTGQRGYAVDPANRDAVIARLTLLQVDSLQVQALITGQVRQVTPKDVVLVIHPRTSWWREKRFLFGLGTGAAMGGLIGTVAR